MTTKRFPLESGGSPRLEITYGWNYKNVIVKLDGLELGRIDDRSQLKLGRDFGLPDGSMLRVQLNENFHTKELLVMRNGEPLLGSSSHPRTIHRTAYGALYVIAALTTVIGVAAIVSGDEKFGGVDGGIGMVVEGLIYALLAWRVSKYSIIALYIAIVLFAADTFLSFPGNVHGLLVRILIFVALIRAVPVTRSLRGAAPALPAVSA